MPPFLPVFFLSQPTQPAVGVEGARIIWNNETSGRLMIWTGVAWVNITSSAEDIGQLAWPVGSVYSTVLLTDPVTIFGFGTWVAIPAPPAAPVKQWKRTA